MSVASEKEREGAETESVVGMAVAARHGAETGGAGPGLVWAWGSGLGGRRLALPLLAVLQHVTEVGLGHH